MVKIMTEIKKDQLKNCDNDIDLLKKLTDFSSDIEIKSDDEYPHEVFYDNTKYETDAVIDDEEFFKLFDNNDEVNSCIKS